MSESSISGKQPKRVIHCSDGTITEYSDDDDAVSPTVEIQQQDSEALTWPSWLWKQASKASKMVTIVSDWMGEKCASLMGVTEPKFDLYIREHEFLKKQEEEDLANTYIIAPEENDSQPMQPEFLLHLSGHLIYFSLCSAPISYGLAVSNTESLI
ncbi:hypothetical protein AAHC03_09410 [Spirometra sp. Aus1]